MYKDKGSTKMSKILFLSMCDGKVFLTFTSLSLALIWQLFYLFCSTIVVNTVIVTDASHIDKNNIFDIFVETLSLYIFTIWKSIVYNLFCRDGIYFDKILVSEYKLFKLKSSRLPSGALYICDMRSMVSQKFL
jgi:hypothetical protein